MFSQRFIAARLALLLCTAAMLGVIVRADAEAPALADIPEDEEDIPTDVQGSETDMFNYTPYVSQEYPQTPETFAANAVEDLAKETVGTVENCAALCNANPDCDAFTWFGDIPDNTRPGDCFIKALGTDCEVPPLEQVNDMRVFYLRMDECTEGGVPLVAVSPTTAVAPTVAVAPTTTGLAPPVAAGPTDVTGLPTTTTATGPTADRAFALPPTGAEETVGTTSEGFGTGAAASTGGTEAGVTGDGAASTGGIAVAVAGVLALAGLLA